MYDEYEKLVKDLQTINIEVDLPISELIREELKDHLPPCPKPLEPYKFGYRYRPVDKEKSKEKVRLGVK